MSFPSTCYIVANNERCVTFTIVGPPTAAGPMTVCSPLRRKVGGARVQMNRHRDLNVQHFIRSDYTGGRGAMVNETRFSASQEHR